MRYLGIDYGEKRIGLALSDPDGKIAFPRETVTKMSEVVAFARREGAEHVILGLPVSFNGAESPQARRIREFARTLSGAVELQVEFENEVLTSKIAEQSSGPEKSDASAAALILQSYLDRKNI